jgi:hypothetical protein
MIPKSAVKVGVPRTRHVLGVFIVVIALFVVGIPAVLAFIMLKAFLL